MNFLKQIRPIEAAGEESSRAPVSAGDLAHYHTSQRIGMAVTGQSESIERQRREQQVRELMARVKAMPEVRLERVEMLRALIKFGYYQPSANDIAAAMLNIGSTSD